MKTYPLFTRRLRRPRRRARPARRPRRRPRLHPRLRLRPRLRRFSSTSNGDGDGGGGPARLPMLSETLFKSGSTTAPPLFFGDHIKPQNRPDSNACQVEDGTYHPHSNYFQLKLLPLPPLPLPLLIIITFTDNISLLCDQSYPSTN